MHESAHCFDSYMSSICACTCKMSSHYTVTADLATSIKAEVMRSLQFVCQSFCVQGYCKSNQLISLKLGVIIGPSNQKN